MKSLKVIPAILACVIIILLNSCGITVRDSSWDYEEGYHDGRNSTPTTETTIIEEETVITEDGENQDLRTSRVVDNHGNVVVVNINSDEEKKETQKVGDSEDTETVKTVKYPKGVNLQCYGEDPFSAFTFTTKSYLTQLNYPTYMKLILSFTNVQELSHLGDEQSSLESVLTGSTLSYTISRIEEKNGKTMITPVKTYEQIDSMPEETRKENNSTFSFNVKLDPIFLQAEFYQAGSYAITDVYLTYQIDGNKYRKVGGGCPKYEFTISDRI